MKSEKAWNKLNTFEHAFEKKSPDAANPENDAPVWPKTYSKELLDLTVNKTLDNLLNEAFEDPEELEKATLKPTKTASSKTAASKTASRIALKTTINRNANKLVQASPLVRRRPDTNIAEQSDVRPLWTAFGIFAFITILFFLHLHQKISSVEAWLHGRLMSAP
jgi:hypothetical protein